MTYWYPNIETIRLARAKVHKLFADGKLKYSLNWILKIDTEECQGEKCIFSHGYFHIIHAMVTKIRIGTQMLNTN